MIDPSPPRSELRTRFELAYAASNAAEAVSALAVQLRDEGLAQAELSALYYYFLGQKDPDERPAAHDAIADALDVIAGGPWAKGCDLYPPERTPEELAAETQRLAEWQRVQAIADQMVERFPGDDERRSWECSVHTFICEVPDGGPSYRAAAQIFWYAGETDEAGHAHYFRQRGLAEAREAVAALAELGGETHRQILLEAIAIREAELATGCDRTADWVELDARHRAAETPLAALLKAYCLERHLPRSGFP